MPKSSKLAAHHDAIVGMLAQRYTHAQIAAGIGVTRVKTVTDYIAKNVTATTAAPSVPGAVTREELLEAEVRELRSAMSKGRKTAVADERLLLAIERALETVHASPAMMRLPDLYAAQQERWDGDAHHRQVLLLSDFHGGETVDAEVVNGLNEYDWEIMEERVDELIAAVLSHQRNSPALTGLDVLFLGDMCSGANHEEITVSNEFPLAEQGVKMGYLMASILERLAPHVPDLRAVSVEGNHPRLEKKPAAKNPHNNMDWVAAIIAAERAKLIGVDFRVARGSAIHEVAGRRCYVWHGDGIRSSMPGVPWGGVMRRAHAIQASMRERIDHYFYGHFHQACVVQGGRIIGNGSLKGTDEWVTKNFGGGDPPTQLLLTFDEKRSRMTDVRYITPTAGVPA